LNTLADLETTDLAVGPTPNPNQLRTGAVVSVSGFWESTNENKRIVF
jgi:hypothetical protein